MCGIAGFCLNPNEKLINSNTLAKRLLIGIEPRGRDATGAAWRVPSTGNLQVFKEDIKAGDFVPKLSIPRRAQTAILHTRMWTQGSPKNPDNNHPILTGGIVGVHNGGIWNDDDIFEDLGIKERRIGEVDSEAAFAALAYGFEHDPVLNTTRIPKAKEWSDVLECIEGTAALAWLDEEDDGNTLHLARCYSSPLVIGQTDNSSLIFASTEWALEDACKSVGLNLVYVEEMKEGMYYGVRDGRVCEVQEFTPGAEFSSYKYVSSKSRWTGSYGGRNYSTVRELPKPHTPTTLDDLEEMFDDMSLGRTWVSTEDGGFVPFEEEMSTSTAGSGGAGEEIPNSYVNVEYLNFGKDIPLMPADLYDMKYGERQQHIDSWIKGVIGGDDECFQACIDLHAWAKPGMWVRTTMIDGAQVFGQLYHLPKTFPHGQYILRVIVPNSLTPNGYEVCFVAREASMFTIHEASWRNSDVERPKEVDALA